MAGLTAGLSGALAATFTPSPAGGCRAEVRSESPLELRGPFPSRGLSTYHLRHTTAGVLAGDAYNVDMTAASGARVQVTASSATKVYGSAAGNSSTTVRLSAEADSLLVWGPHAGIVHAGAAYRQETAISLAAGSRVVFAEALALGRLAGGERYAFRRLENQLRVTDGERTLYSEAYVLTPGEDLAAAMAGHGVLVSIYALGFKAEMGLEPTASVPGALSGWSRLPNDAGIVVRGLTDSLSRGQALCESVIGQLLLASPVH